MMLKLEIGNSKLAFEGENNRFRFSSFLFRPLLMTLRMIKFEHSIFALPFAFLGALLAAEGWPTGQQAFWIVVAMVGGRSAAMAFNRIADLRYDKINPRTAARELPTGKLSLRFTWAFVVVSSAALVFAAWRLNPLAFRLSPLVLTVLLLYSYTKRFTTLSHWVLGFCLGMAPAGAWVAVRGALDWRISILTVAVMFWVAGFDVIYSTADLDVDREQGIHSIPARFGVAGALYSARAFHAVTVGALIGAGVLFEVSFVYYLGVAVAAVLLAYEHSLISPRDLSRLGAAFFTMNGIIAIVFGTFVAVSTVVD